MSKTMPTAAEKKTPRKLPAKMSPEQVKALIAGNEVTHRESSKVYVITELTPEGKIKGKLKESKPGVPNGPRVLNPDNFTTAEEAAAQELRNSAAELGVSPRPGDTEPTAADVAAAGAEEEHRRDQAGIVATVEAVTNGNLAEGVTIPAPAKKPVAKKAPASKERASEKAMRTSRAKSKVIKKDKQMQEDATVAAQAVIAGDHLKELDTPLPDPATVAPNGPAAKLAATSKPAQASPEVVAAPATEQVNAGGGIMVDVPKSEPAAAPVQAEPLPAVSKFEVAAILDPEGMKAALSTKPATPVKLIFKSPDGISYARMTQERADFRNSNRKESGKEGQWLLVSEDDVPAGAEIAEPSEVIAQALDRIADPAAATKRAKQDKAVKDTLDWVKRKSQEQAARAAQQPKAPAADAAVEMKPRPVTAKPAAAAPKTDGRKSSRPTWNGIGMCEYLRYAGSQGWSRKVMKVVAEKIGFKPSPTTIHIQGKMGEDGLQVPTVDQSTANELASYAKEAEAVVGAATKGNKAKPAPAAEPKMQVRPVTKK